MKRFCIVLLFTLLPSVALSDASWPTGYNPDACTSFPWTGPASVSTSVAQSIYGAVFPWPTYEGSGGTVRSYWTKDSGADHLYTMLDAKRVWSGGSYQYTQYVTYKYVPDTETCDLPPDEDGDGVIDSSDNCPGTPPATPVDASGCPLEPDHCSNFVRDWDEGTNSWLEDGVDCGSLCAGADTTCTDYCSTGFHAESRPYADAPETYYTACYADDSNTSYTVEKIGGVCPQNYVSSSTNSALCVRYANIFKASADYTTPVDAPETIQNPWNTTTSAETSTHYNSTTVYNGVTTEVDTWNYSGVISDTETQAKDTVQTTVTNPDGSKTVTTSVTKYVVDTTGASSPTAYGSTKTTTTSYDVNGAVTGVSENTELFGSSSSLSGGFGDTVLPLINMDNFVDRFNTFKSDLQATPALAPLYALFTPPEASALSSFDFSMGTYGEKSWNLSDYESIWTLVGYLFQFLALVAAARLVIVGL